MASYGINAGDVANAIRRQNIDVPAGRIGQPPTISGQVFDVPIDALGRLTTPEQFGEIIVKTDQGIAATLASAAGAAAGRAARACRDREWQTRCWAALPSAEA